MSGRRFWTEAEDAFLVANHGKLTLAQIAAELGRSRDSVKTRAKCVDIEWLDDVGYQPNECRIRILAWAFRLRRVEQREETGYAGAPPSMRMEREKGMVMRRRGLDHDMMSVKLGSDL